MSAWAFITYHGIDLIAYGLLIAFVVWWEAEHRTDH